VDGEIFGLVDLDGSPIRLADLRGHPVWINFWATWCPPCQEETPVLQRVFETHEAEGLVVLAISVQESSPEDVRRYVETYGLTYRVGFDATSAVFKTYRAYGLPTQLFLDRDGIIRVVHKGPLTRLDAERILAPIILGD
jgi:peroxiredoxin